MRRMCAADAVAAQVPPCAMDTMSTGNARCDAPDERTSIGD